MHASSDPAPAPSVAFPETGAVGARDGLGPSPEPALGVGEAVGGSPGSASPDLGELWDQAGALISRALGSDNFQRWFAEVSLLALDDAGVTLGVPNSIYPLWIEVNYRQTVVDALAVVTGRTLQLSFEILEDSTPGGAADTEGVQDLGIGPVTPPIDEDEEDAPVTGSSFARPAARLSDAVFQRSGVLPRFSFDNFVVGDSNRYANAAAKAVAEAPGRAYNPLFLHSDPGLGKTHLMHAIGHAVLQRNPRARVLFRTSEEWVNEFIEALGRSSLSAFRSRYRNIDVLLLDDVQFLGGKEQSKSEFFHTFNTLFDGHKQIVLSSDCPARNIRQIEDRLRSRFDAGLTAELSIPNRETRLAILRSKAQKFPSPVDPRLLEFLADRVTSDVRSLEGALTRTASYLALSSTQPTLAELEVHLRDLIEVGSERISIDTIQRAVVEHFDLRLADMTNRDRRAAVAFPRQVAMLLSRQLTNSTLKDIGEAFGNRDHGTVLHAVNKLQHAQGRDRADLDQHLVEIRRRMGVA